MVSATEEPTVVNEEIYDPDSPPEDRGFVGRLTISAYVQGNKVTPSWGDENDQRIVEVTRKYGDKAKYTGPCWFLEVEGIEIVREDGAPFRQHDIVKLQSVKGANLGAKQAPDQLAKAFQAHGLTASYTKVGASNTAIGRIFRFAQRDLKLGRNFEKPVRLFPVESFAEDYVFDGEVRVIKPRAEDESEGAPRNAGRAPAMSEDAAIEILKSVLNGCKPDAMMDLLIQDGRLNTTPSIFGVALMESATDETLAGVLVEHGVMTQAKDGTLSAA